MKRIADFIVNKRIVIIPIALLLTFLFAALIPRVAVNYNMADYLPEESQTRIGLERMQETFGESGTFDVMLLDTSAQNAETVKSDLQAMESISLVSFDANSDHHYKNGNALLQVSIPDDTYSETANDAILSTENYLEDSGLDYHLGGAAYSNYSLQNSVTEEIPVILLMAVLIIMTLLSLNARSWLEPFMFMTVIAMAIVMNLGSNVIYGEISYITQSVAAVLQLGLSMNYSIILINRFYQEKRSGDTPSATMKRALGKSIKPIVSSSLTTVAGMLALSFMTFQLGMDLGIVLAKGILISLLSVLIILPGVLVVFGKPIERTQKRRLAMPSNPFSAFALKARAFIPILTVLLFVGAIFIHSTNQYTFSDTPDLEGETAIEETFGDRETVVLMIEKSEDALEEERNFIEALETVEDSPLMNYQGVSNTVYQPLSASTVASNMDADPLLSEMLFTLYQMDEGDLEGREVEMKPLLTFLYNAVKSNDYDDLFSETMRENIIETYETLEYFGWPERDPMTYEGLAENSGNISVEEAKLAYAFYFTENDISESITLQATTLMNYMETLLSDNTLVADMMPDSMSETLEDSQEDLSLADSMFESEEARRLILTLELEEEGSRTFDYVETLNRETDTHFEDEVYLTGMIITNYDLADTFDEDLLKISLVTVSAIILLVAITFRAALLPFILVIIIQGAIWMSMSVNALIDKPLHFLGYIVVTAIQMGATVDYGILIASNYLENRNETTKNEAIKRTMKQSLTTVTTSALILITAGLAVGIFSSQKVISSMGNLIARGAFVSGLFVLFLLPGVLHTLDTPLMKSTHGKRNTIHK
ncbi:MAG: efflux RND transporter permease subunit [Bacillota bacterium]